MSITKEKNEVRSTPPTPPIDDTAEPFLPKRIIILNAIKAGGATRDSLMKVAEVSTKSLASQFSYLRLMGHFPHKDEDGTYSLMDEQAWLAKKSEAKSNRKPAMPLNPAKRKTALLKKLVLIEKRVNVAANLEVSPAKGSVDSIKQQIDVLTVKLYNMQIEALTDLIGTSTDQEVLSGPNVTFNPSTEPDPSTEPVAVATSVKAKAKAKANLKP